MLPELLQCYPGLCSAIRARAVLSKLVPCYPSPYSAIRARAVLSEIAHCYPMLSESLRCYPRSGSAIRPRAVLTDCQDNTLLNTTSCSLSRNLAMLAELVQCNPDIQICEWLYVRYHHGTEESRYIYIAVIGGLRQATACLAASLPL